MKKRKRILAGIFGAVLSIQMSGAVLAAPEASEEEWRYDEVEIDMHQYDVGHDAGDLVDQYDFTIGDGSEFFPDLPFEDSEQDFEENEEKNPLIIGENGEVIRTAALDLREKESTDRLDSEGWKWEDVENGGTLILNNCHFRTEENFNIVAEGDVTIVLYGTNTIDVPISSYFFRPMITGDNFTIVAGDETGSLEFRNNTGESLALERLGIAADNLTIESGNIFSDIQFCDINYFFRQEGGNLSISVDEEQEIGIVLNYSNHTDSKYVLSGGSLEIDAYGAGIYGAAEVTGGEVDIQAGVGIIGAEFVIDSADRFVIDGRITGIYNTAGGVDIRNVGEEFCLRIPDCKYGCYPILPMGNVFEPEPKIQEADYTRVNEAVAAAESLNPKDYKSFAAVEKAVKAVKYGQGVVGDRQVIDGYAVLQKRPVDDYADAIYAAIDALEPVPEVGKVSLKKVQTWGYNAVKLTWDRAENADGYRLYYAEKAGEPWKYVTQIANGETVSYIHTGRTTGKNYTYYVRAYTVEDGVKYFGSYSDGKSGKAVPKQVKITKAKAQKGKAALAWNKVNGASGYRIYYKNSENGKWHYVTQIGKGSTTSYTHKGIQDGKDYYYTMRAYRVVNGKKVFGAYAEWKQVDI